MKYPRTLVSTGLCLLLLGVLVVPGAYADTTSEPSSQIVEGGQVASVDQTENRSTDGETPEIAIDSITLNESTIEPNEQAKITVIVENSGAVDGRYTLRLDVAGTELQAETVTVDAGDQQTVEFSQQFTAPGVYDLSVNGERVSLAVEAPDDSDAESISESEDTVPGFGAIAVLSVLLVAVIAVRLRDR